MTMNGVMPAELPTWLAFLANSFDIALDVLLHPVQRSPSMFQRILVPLDGSKQAEQAIPVAARIARATGGSLVFINVVFVPAEAGNHPFGSFIASQEGACEAQMAQAEEYLSSPVTTAYAT